MNTKPNTRDQHSPANILPENYSYVGSFYQGPYSKYMLDLSGLASWDALANTALMKQVRDEGGYIGNWVERSSCDCCGANFLYGQVWVNTITNELVAVGSTCGESTFGEDDRASLDLKTMKSRVAAAKKSEKLRVEVEKFLSENEGLEATLDLGDSNSNDYELRTLANLKKNLNRYGSLTEKQIAFANKLAEATRTGETKAKKEAEREARYAEAIEERSKRLESAEPWTSGRTEIEGKIVSVREGDPYTQYATDKMLVELDDGRRCWGSIPSFVLREEDYEDLEDLKGRRVAFRARITLAAEDQYFAFYSRPTKIRGK